MVIELERRKPQVVKCVKYKRGENLQDVLEVLGSNYSIAYSTEPFELIISHKYNKTSFHVRDGQYIVNDSGNITVTSAYALLQNYIYLDIEKGWTIEDDADCSIESRQAFFKKVKELLS